jgi:hypothetical protein
MIGVPAALISAYKGIKECYGRFQWEDENLPWDSLID